MNLAALIWKHFEFLKEILKASHRKGAAIIQSWNNEPQVFVYLQRQWCIALYWSVKSRYWDSTMNRDMKIVNWTEIFYVMISGIIDVVCDDVFWNRRIMRPILVRETGLHWTTLALVSIWHNLLLKQLKPIVNWAKLMFVHKPSWEYSTNLVGS